MSKKEKSVSESTQKASMDSLKARKPILSIVLKVSIISILIIAGILYSDYKGFFKPDNRNNHTDRKWNSFYEFSSKNDVDIILIGNSHLYTGINPKNLSTALGCNSFILASPGTQVVDHYYALKEAIRIKKPKLVIVETYGLLKSNPYEMKKDQLSNQFKSFYAREKSFSKLASTPFLFSVKNYPYAWSNTLRNHDFLTSNYSQIKENLKDDKPRSSKNQKLYLGRYVRFQTGIEENTLKKYDSLGAPVNGLDYETNDYQDIYIKKIVDLCNEQGIQFMFLTLPMYHKHIINYSDWKSKLATSIGNKYSTDEYWFDMQVGETYNKFSTASFENTYKKNQHMTYGGSLLATYALVDFIHSKERIKLPNRSRKSKWRKLFYGDEGFFENNLPSSKKDGNNKILYRSKTAVVKEVLLIKQGKQWKLIAKVKPKSTEQHNLLISQKPNLSVDIKNKNGQIQKTNVTLNYDVFHSSSQNMVYTMTFTPVDIVKVNSIKFIK